MDGDSRKAQRNSFAHHRAELLFKQPEIRADTGPRYRQWAAPSIATPGGLRRWTVADGLSSSLSHAPV